jgi:dTDP-glucose pyrophosphorylase/CBS domain-containing protein
MELIKDWHKILIKPTDDLRKGIKVLHNGGLRIVLIIDKNKKLLGTLTDGDIRRALISNTPMDSMVSSAMNSHPKTVDHNTPRQEIIDLMENDDLLHMPIINEGGKLCDLVTLQQLHRRQKYKNPVFIMAGGFGTRLYPLTKEIPKPLLKVGDKAILDIIISQFVNCGFENFYISTHYMPEKIRNNFADKDSSDINIEFIHEDIPLGTAGSLGLLPENISKLPIIVMNGDLLTKVDFGNLLDFHRSNKAEATMCVREYDFQVPYGVVEVNNHKIKGIKEKPVHKFFVNAGIYVVNHSLIQKIDGTTYLDMTDFLEGKLDKEKVSAFPIHEYWIDIGQVDEYNKANRDIHTIF